MADAEAQRDRAGKGYWDEFWSGIELPAPVNPRDTGVRNYTNRRFAAYLDEMLRGLPPGAEVLEVGCAQSPWLPFFAREHPIRVCGLDYSQHGSDMEREMLRRANVDGEVVCADLFDPPDGLLNRFDAVVSFGVVEHFTDTAACVLAISRFMKPGGRLVTEIPNLNGSLGFIERLVNPAVYDVHVPLTPRDLAVAHERAGLRVEESRYFLSASFGLWSLHGLPDTRRKRALALAQRNLSRLSYLVWLLESRTRPIPATRVLSPYVLCSARKRD